VTPPDFNVPRIDWSKWDAWDARTRREIANQCAALIATAPLYVQSAIFVAMSKRTASGKRRKVAEPPIIGPAHQLIIDQFQLENGDVDVPKKLAAFRKRFNRPMRDDWQETRKALLIAAVEEVAALRVKLPVQLARRVVAKRYRGLLLGVSSNTGEQVKLRVGQKVLWQVEKLGAHLPGGSPAALHMDLYLCGRRRKGESLS
jgi:hypothetical protein